MEFLTELWLPILLSAVFVFIVSSVIHMALPIHNNDFKKINNEDVVLDAMRANDVKAGCYMFPWAGSMKELGTPEMIEKMKRGPVGWLTVAPPGGLNIGKSLVWWFVFSLIVGILVAYAGWHSLGAGPGYLQVFRLTGVAAVLGYAVGHFHNSIWRGASWATTGKFIAEGVVYGLVTAGTFGWLWPEAV